MDATSTHVRVDRLCRRNWRSHTAVASRPLLHQPTCLAAIAGQLTQIPRPCATLCHCFPQDFGGAGDGACKRRRWGGKEGGGRIRGRKFGGVEGVWCVCAGRVCIVFVQSGGKLTAAPTRLWQAIARVDQQRILLSSTEALGRNRVVPIGRKY